MISLRIFELLSLLANLVFLFLVCFPGKAAPSKRLIAGGANAAVLGLHLALEGGRWQMAFSYIVFSITAAFVVVNILQKSRPDRRARRFPRFLGALLGLLVLLSAGLAACLPVVALPRPAGPLTVGSRTFHFIDKSRAETLSKDHQGQRELMVQVWYPAENIRGHKRLSVVPDGRRFLQGLAKGLHIPEIFLDYFKYVKSHSYSQGDLSSSQMSYPLILLSHGLGSSRIFHVTQAENLASHGYIVAAIDHSFCTVATLFPDGRVTANETSAAMMESYEFLGRIGRVWTEDILFVLDQFAAIAAGSPKTIFEGKIDLANVGAFGHSFGGAAAYDAGRDSRIKAGIDMDGTLYGFLNRDSLSKPFLFMYSEQTLRFYNIFRPGAAPSDLDLQAFSMSRKEYEEALKQGEWEHIARENEHIQGTLAAQGRLMYILESKHYNYADIQWVSPLIRLVGLTGRISPSRMSRIVNRYVLEFFDRHLKNKTDKDSVERPPAEPEVRYGSSLLDGIAN